MAADELLQSKYDRLCVEFKKLRTRYRELKESTSKDLVELQQLREQEKSRELLVVALQKECEDLRFRNASLCKNVGIEKPSNVPTDELPPDGGVQFDLSLDNVRLVQEVSESIPNTIHQHTNEAHTTPQPSDNLHSILKDLSAALHAWTESISTKSKTANLSQVHQALVDRIAQLESQVCELSVQCQLERKRRLMNNEVPDHSEDTIESVRPHERMYESLVIEGLQERVKYLTDQAQYFAGLATFLQDEIKCLTPKVMGLAQEACLYRTEATKAHSLIQKIQHQLDQVNNATLKQSNEMAQHIANLTDELQELRSGLYRNNSFDTASNSSKKNSIFSVLKR